MQHSSQITLPCAINVPQCLSRLMHFSSFQVGGKMNYNQSAKIDRFLLGPKALSESAVEKYSKNSK